jgi:hypothetical protein
MNEIEPGLVSDIPQYWVVIFNGNSIPAHMGYF